MVCLNVYKNISCLMNDGTFKRVQNISRVMNDGRLVGCLGFMAYQHL